MLGILRYAAVATPLAVLVFLVSSGFFTQWQGHAISFRPSQDTEAANHRVLILTDDNEPLEAVWPADLVKELNLPANARALPPAEAPDDAPLTTKAPYSLSFSVKVEDTTRILPTNATTALGIAILLWILGLIGRNMVVSGSPLRLDPVEGSIVPDLRPSAPTASAAAPPTPKSQRTRPPGKKRRGQGRRG